MRRLFIVLAVAGLWSCSKAPSSIEMSQEELLDKIKGGHPQLDGAAEDASGVAGHRADFV